MMATWRNGYAEDCKSYPLFYLPTLFPHEPTYLLLIQTARGLWSTPGQLSALKLLKDVVPTFSRNQSVLRHFVAPSVLRTSGSRFRSVSG